MDVVLGKPCSDGFLVTEGVRGDEHLGRNEDVAPARAYDQHTGRLTVRRGAERGPSGAQVVLAYALRGLRRLPPRGIVGVAGGPSSDSLRLPVPEPGCRGGPRGGERALRTGSTLEEDREGAPVGDQERPGVEPSV